MFMVRMVRSAARQGRFAGATLTKQGGGNSVYILLLLPRDAMIRAPVTTLSSQEFRQDTSQAKKADATGLVFIIGWSIIDALGWPVGVEDIEIEFPKSSELAPSADLS
ncbi:MAG: hypothetical protein FWD68_20185 [Alphaproteobacteria bacterium]|nr:hypothetical protein [Alphaproteobacteria bacterium]